MPYDFLIRASGLSSIGAGVFIILARVVPFWIGLLMLLSMLLAAVLPTGIAGVASILLNGLMGIGPILFGFWLLREGGQMQRRSI